MAKPVVTLDYASFRAGLRRRLDSTKRAVPVVVNKASKNVCLRAVQFTPKASAAKIRSDLTTNGLALRLLQSPAMQGRLPRKLQGFTRGTHTKAQLDEAARQLVGRAVQSVAYIKAGWVKAAQAFGGATRSKVSDKGLAGQSYGKPASVARPVAEGGNAARGAVKVGTPALQQALNFVGKDLVPDAQKTMATAFNR